LKKCIVYNWSHTWFNVKLIGFAHTWVSFGHILTIFCGLLFAALHWMFGIYQCPKLLLTR